MNPEIKQQLYGGEISDYYPINQKNNSPEKDYKNIGDIYQQMLDKNTIPNLPSNIKNKVKFTK